MPELGKDALQYVAEVLAPTQRFEGDEHGELFSKAVARPPLPHREPRATTLKLRTLRSFAEYVASEVDKLDLSAHLVHVESPAEVNLLSRISGFYRDREAVVSAVYEPVACDGTWQDLERAIINLLANFAPTGDRDKVVQVLKRVTRKETEVHEDDGVSQTVTATVGVQTIELASLPNPVTLAPYRTFTEVEQPSSLFLLRMRDAGPAVLLQQADGGGWKVEAVARIGAYLKTALASTLGDKAPKVIF